MSPTRAAPPPSAAPTAPPRYRLEVLARAGADRCPTAERLVPAVVARVGHDPFDETAGARLLVTFERGASGYDARIERFGPEGRPAGKKSLSGPSCEALADALALSIAIAVDAPLPPPPAASLSAGPPPTPRPVPPGAVPEPWEGGTWGETTPPPKPPPKTTPTGPKAFAQIGVGALVAGAAPRIAPLATLGLGLSSASFSAHLEGVGTLATSEEGARARIATSVLGGRPVLCRTSLGHTRLSLCLQGFLGALRGSADGIGGKHASTFFATAGASLSGAWPLGRLLELVPSIGPSFTLTRTTLYASEQAVFTTHPVGVDATLALRASL